MAINPGNRDYREWADTEAQEYKGRTSPTEAFGASFGHTIDEDLSISRFLHNDDEKARDLQLRKMIETGEISSDIELSFTTWAPAVGYKVDYSGLSQYVNEELGLKLPTDEELMISRNEMLANRRAERQDIIERAGGSGQMAAFAGGFAASMADPVGIAAGVATAGIGTGLLATSKAMRNLSMSKFLTVQGAAEGAVGGVLGAAAVEPFIYAWKEEIGSPYTFTDAMFNITASGVMGGGLGGFIGKMKSMYGIRNTDDFDANVARFREMGASEAEAAELSRTLYDVGQAPGKQTPEQYFEDLHAREVDVETGIHATKDDRYDATETDVIEAQYQESKVARDEAGIKNPYDEILAEYQLDTDHSLEIIRCLKNG